MSATLISAEGLGKRYVIGSQRSRSRSLRDRLTEGVRSLRKTGLNGENPREFWALRDVSFELRRGEVLGVIGRNGAGKSTLLKIMSEITEPTEGEAHILGRVASLLEVGVGFHPELTGRENVFLNGAILGMGRAEIRRKFDEIVAFAEIEKFIDTPVKRYSSGMYVRLAFAVAAHLEPDVLIIDEVLAVGDAAFQRKCLGKIESVARGDRAVMVVSHNMSIVTQLCEQVVWLEGGRIAATGETARVVSAYMSQGLANNMTWKPAKIESEVFEYHEIVVSGDDPESTLEAIPASSPITIRFDFTVKEIIPSGRLSIRVSREDGLVVLTSSNTDNAPAANAPWRLGRQHLQLSIPGQLLSPATYLITVSEPLESGNTLHENILSFTVSDQNSLVARDQREGVITPLIHWREDSL
jgi:lipopolysaccharide transport system ATP-binding protein